MAENILATTSDSEESDAAVKLVKKFEDQTEDGGGATDFRPESIQNDTSRKDQKTFVFTPVEQNDFDYKQSEIRKNTVKIDCFVALKYCIYFFFGVISLCIAIFTIFHAYGLTSIAEPIGAIKNEMQHLQDYNKEEVVPRLREWDEANTQLKVKKIIISDI